MNVAADTKFPITYCSVGRTYAALNQTDSAKYYYQQAATSTSEFIAMEANALFIQSDKSRRLS